MDETTRAMIVKGVIKKKKTGDEKTAKSLHYSVMEGAFNSASNSIVNAYTIPYALALKANNAEIGLLSSVQNLATTFAQLPGASLTQYMSRKSIWVISAIASKLLWIPIILVAFLPFNAVIILIALLGLFSFFNSLRNPAWTSLIGDIVPDGIRGKFFGKRNMITGIAGLAATIAMGFTISSYGFPFVFAISIILGLLSVIFFVRIHEVEFRRVFHYKHTLSFNPRNLANALRVNRTLVLFTLFVAAVNFAVHIAAPFFVVYMLKNMNIGYVWFTLIISFNAVVTLLSGPYWGKFADRYGERKILLITGILISFVPFFYLFASSVPHLLLIEGFSGFAWAGFDLVAFNFLLAVTPAEKRPTYVANHTFFKGIAVFAGAIIGGFLAYSLANSSFLWLYGLQIIFLISFLLRIASLPIMLKIQEPRIREDAVPVRYVFWRAVAIEPVRGITHAIDFTFRYPQKIYDMKRKLAMKLRQE